LSGILSPFRILVSWNASSCSLYLFDSIIILVTYTTAVVRFWITWSYALLTARSRYLDVLF
jgi:hypothetical protein